MKSLDTNILLYGANEDCKEHAAAAAIIEEALQAPNDWIIADQVLFEFYRAIRHPSVVSKPLSAAEATKRIAFLREESGFSFCCHELRNWPDIRLALARSSFQQRSTHDLVLGVTLRKNGVTTFYTRNVKDFRDTGFTKLINPID